ncbi:histidine phosphatase family protein [uncultured Chryseobacterium sp.]|uniref:SixA phosphatase family protein n=1 Tax=uncultured Chryseobacterium sp. TaxID=259322 RepID=UPI002634393A|nr:histidine phosphatase family protein [uncultured Chryseobacterium sp.]
MKTLILVRHAKSDWTHDLPDFDRPLNDRGHKDAPRMARFVHEKGIEIQQFVTSPAKRALTTCRYFSEVYENKDIKKVEELYHASSKEFLETINELDDKFDHVALFSHNNGISDFASSLTSEPVLFPTCGVAVFEIDCEEWSQFEGAEKKLLHFFAPKEVL